MPITLSLTHPDPSVRHLDGFLFFWGFYVRGFDPSRHCQNCLRGMRSHLLLAGAPLPDGDLVFDETGAFNELYICGVAAGPRIDRGKRNLHLPLIPSPSSNVEVTTYNGYTLRVRNASLLALPDPDPALAHLGEDHYRCGNFRFGVSRYGYQAPLPL